MKVNEIFLSIEGEGKRAGLPAVFIRFFGCNANCSYCFGVKPGRVNPKLRRGYLNTDFRGNHNLKLTDAKVGDWIMTYDDAMNLVETQITSLSKREVTEWYEVKIDNTLYYITPEHPIFTVNGLKRVDELTVGDYIIECDPNKYLSYMSKVRNCMKDPDTITKRLEHTDYAAIGRKQSEQRAVIFATIRELLNNEVPLKDWPDECIRFYNAYMNREYSDEYRQKLSERMKGPNNPNYDPNAVHRPNYESLKQMVREGKITRSQLSGKTLLEDNAQQFHVHHIDGDNANDNWDNLIVVTSREHNQIHERGYSFWKSERKDGKRLSTLVDNNGKEVQSIKYVNITNHPYLGKYYGPDKLTVYTLSCEPYNTYLIDNMWVHNCDSVYACKGDDYREMSIDEIIEEIEKYQCNNITVTGGEPLIHKNITEFLQRLIDEGYDTNVETNGTIKPEVRRLDYEDNLSDGTIFYTMDYKCPSSGAENLMKIENFKSLRDEDVVKFVVGSVKDLCKAYEIVTELEDECLCPQIYFSPVFGEIEPKDIVKFLLDNKMYHCKVQLQLHKYIYPVDMRGV